jgi:hypothetical protein
MVLAPRPLPRDHVLHGRHQDAGEAQTEVLLEVGVLGGDDRLPQHGAMSS